MCGIEINYKDDAILSIKGDKLDVFSQGFICPKAVALQDLHTDKDRIKTPLRKTKLGWEEISWETALKETADTLKFIQERHGRDAVGIYFGNPTAHNHGAMLTIPLLLSALKTRNRFSATSVDQLPHMLACYKMFGHQALFPIPDIENTDFFLCLGGNPAVSGGSIFSVPGFKDRIKKLQARGGKFILIDPRKTETAELADQHFFIRPG
ncbi:MAG TPA: molybdopterin-dependent oxidoreductase, partial [Pseudomonadales bacterium]|nr:molybdopterin-dependent oxidoreductase [Pseudomonadales bacterium]